MRKTNVVLIALFLLVNFSFYAQCQGSSVAVFSVDGEVKIVPKGSSSGIKCSQGMDLSAGDWIKTGPNSSVMLSFDNKADNVVRIEENSLVVIKLDGYFKIQLLRGEINAILENVEKEDSFRVLTPSVVTESLNSGWGASSDGERTNVVVFDNKILVCGIDEEGQMKEKKYWVEEGYQRKTLKFEDPGEMKSVPEKVMSWFKEQVVSYHLSKIDSSETVDSYTGGLSIADNLIETERPFDKIDKEASGEKKYSSSGQKADLLEYLYKQRLRQ